MPRADCATKESAITEARARSSRACSSEMSISGSKPHSGASIASAACTSTRGSPERTVQRVRLGRRQARLERAVDEQAPDLLEGHLADEVLDVDAAVAQRAALLVGLGDLGGEGDDALEAGLDFSLMRSGRFARSAPRTRPLTDAAYAALRTRLAPVDDDSHVLPVASWPRTCAAAS